MYTHIGRDQVVAGPRGGEVLPGEAMIMLFLLGSNNNNRSYDNVGFLVLPSRNTNTNYNGIVVDRANGNNDDDDDYFGVLTTASPS